MRAPLLIVACLTVANGIAAAEPLRVCADPNNYPFSDARGAGFENRIAELLARDLGTRVEYTWWAQRRGFFRNTIKARLCDVVVGVPTGLEMLHTTRPYYRSSYVFVTRKDRALDIHSLDDERLRTLRVGVQLIGDDGVNAPPAHALARRGIVDNVVGYSVQADYSIESPPAEIIRAVERGDIDVAIAWGPLAGAFARRSRRALVVRPVGVEADAGLPLAFSIAVGVRHGDEALARRIDRVLRRRHREIAAILDEFGVPRVHPRPREEPR